jgi:hypothetical protein
MFKVLFQVAKEDPKEFWSGILFFVLMFTGLWTLLWLDVIIDSFK